MNKFKMVFSGLIAAILLFSFALSASAATGSFYRYQSNFRYPSYYKYWQQVPQTPQQPTPGQPAPQQPAPEQPAPQQPAPQQPPTNTPGAAGLTADEQQMVDLVNSERANNGLAPLTVNTKLTEMARVKAQDMIDNNYFSHTSPTYGSPFDMMKTFGISYKTAGENIAGNSSVTGAHNALMNSSGHRANILNSNFKEVGIGIVDGGPYGKMFVQDFIG